MGGLAAWVVKWTASGMFKLRFDEAFKSLKVYLEGKGEGGAGIRS